MAKYIIRIDEVAPNMDWRRFEKVAGVLDRAGVSPLFGVIPDNKDPELLRLDECPTDFWEYIRERQEKGWTLALHGYQHLLREGAGGRLRINSHGEFPGLSVGQQERMLEAGLKIFGYHGLKTDVFMPPAHSYDKATLRAMRQVGLKTLTDGLSILPYRRQGVLCVPQQFATPRTVPIGVITFCLHPNQMTDDQIIQLERFIDENRSNIIDFPSAEQYATSGLLQRPVEAVMRTVMGITRRGNDSKANNEKTRGSL